MNNRFKIGARVIVTSVDRYDAIRGINLNDVGTIDKNGLFYDQGLYCVKFDKYPNEKALSMMDYQLEEL